MAEKGVGELHVDDVARRAAVGKATLYRRYRSKDELVTAAVKELVSEIAIPDTGSTADDVRSLMLDAVEGLPRFKAGGRDARPRRSDETRRAPCPRRP